MSHRVPTSISIYLYIYLPRNIASYLNISPFGDFQGMCAFPICAEWDRLTCYVSINNESPFATFFSAPFKLTLTHPPTKKGRHFDCDRQSATTSQLLP